jgi:GNAT superfamily N-acetyltransferase
MTSAYSVRPTRHGDLASVLEVLADNQSGRPMQQPAPAPPPSDRQVAMWKRIANSPDVTVYLAELDRQPVGTTCLSILPNITYDCHPTAFIEAVVVRYDHRRRGVARLMIRRALEDARREGCFKVQLLTHKRHATDGAHDLYRSLGFEAEAEGFRLYLRDT